MSNNYQQYGGNPYGQAEAGYGGTGGYGGPEPGVLPTHDAYGNEIDSSDRESLQEARDDYEEALEEAASSSASSSEREELEEAREEYEEEYEEAYYDE